MPARLAALDRHLREPSRHELEILSPLLMKGFSARGSDNEQTSTHQFLRGTTTLPDSATSRSQSGCGNIEMSPVTLAILLVVISVLIFCSALFSGVETALFHSSRINCAVWKQITSALQIREVFPGKSASRPECASPGDGVIIYSWSHCALSWEGPLAERIPQWAAGFAIFAIIVLLCDLVPKLLAVSVPYRLSTIGAFARRYRCRFLTASAAVSRA
jgi:hypothetical protein